MFCPLRPPCIPARQRSAISRLPAVLFAQRKLIQACRQVAEIWKRSGKAGTARLAFASFLVLMGCLMQAQAQVDPNVVGDSTIEPSSLPLTSYVPLDSWVYGAIDRLHALGFLDTAYLGMKPYTRLSISHMLQASEEGVAASGSSEAKGLQQALEATFPQSWPEDDLPSRAALRTETVYARGEEIAGLPLRDSFHLGQSLVNDYGRPYERGFNAINGFSTTGSSGRASLYVRGEYQHAPSATGYNQVLANQLAILDQTPYSTNANQATIPLGPIAQTDVFRLIEAYATYNLGGHQLSFGKIDHWLSPALGGSFAFGNNSESPYTLQIDRLEPLSIPLVSRLIGPVRYLFFVGSLKGHTDPNDPWMHVEKISFKPTPDLEFGFERSVIWGGRGHVPITFGTFYRSFTSVQNIPLTEKFSNQDPGARFGTFDFSYRLPFIRRRVTLYTDSLAHDDVSPVSAPRRAGIRPGVYLASVPGFPKLDFRVEAASTDPPTSRSIAGMFLYQEGVQLQGYTIKGLLMGDPIGREDKGGQGWLTYHLSPQEQVQFTYKQVKAAKDFIQDGTTQNSYSFLLTKRLRPDVELRAHVQREAWKAPIFDASEQQAPRNHVNTSIAVQVTWFPKVELAR